MIKQAECELDLIYHAFKRCNLEKISDFSEFFHDGNMGGYFDSAGNKFSPAMRFYGFLIGLRGFDKFPVVVSDYKFNKLNRKPMFHGFQKFDHGASILTDFNYHIGMGNRTLGTYFSELKDDARRYTVSTKFGEERILNDKCIMKAKIISDNFINLARLEYYCYHIINSQIENIEECNDKQKIIALYNFCLNNKNQENNTLEDERFEKYRLYNEIVSNPVVLALYLGYDYVKKIYHGTNIEHNILLNRGVMCTCKSQADKFTSMSENYKDAVVNFIDDFDFIEEKIK